LDAHVDRLRDRLTTLPAEMADNPAAVQQDGRRLVTGMALALQGALLVRHSPPAVADAFCGSRLGPGAVGWTFGLLESGCGAGKLTEIIDRHTAGPD
jgi:putative acyl-CoA dehydrogenase